MLPRVPEDITADWVAPVLVRRGVVPAGTAIDLNVTRIGDDRGFTGTIARIAWTGGTVIAKLPDAAGPELERCAREVRFYEHLAARAGVRVPEMWHGEVDPRAGAVAMLLEDVPGRGGDAETGCPVSDAATVIDAMAAMHARWWRDPTLADLGWLPHWGQGTAGRDAPHRRAVDRFRRRIEPFFAMYGDAAALGLRQFTEDLALRAEDVYVALAELPATLIHADLHLDNLIFGPGGAVVVIDWQSVSRGPGVRDLTLFLAGSLTGAADHRAFPDLVRRYADALVAGGVPVTDLRDLDTHVRLALLRCLAGFVSGYGGRRPPDMTDREVRMVRAAIAADGLAGVVLEHAA